MREAQPLDLAKVPKEGKAPGDFVPGGWKVEATTKEKVPVKRQFLEDVDIENI